MSSCHAFSRPQFIALYISEPDHSAHLHGPDSPEVNAALGVVDKSVGRLWDGLQKRNISDCINLMIVSDHGMSLINFSKLVYVTKVSGLLPE